MRVCAYKCICVRCLSVVHGAFRIVKETILSAQFLLLFALRLRVVMFVCVCVGVCVLETVGVCVLECVSICVCVCVCQCPCVCLACPSAGLSCFIFASTTFL